MCAPRAAVVLGPSHFPLPRGLAAASGHDDGQMPARPSRVATVREEALRLGVRAPADVFDMDDARGAELALDDGREVHVGPGARAIDDAGIAVRGREERGRDFLPHLEAGPADVRAERGSQRLGPCPPGEEARNALGREPARDAPPAAVHGRDEAGARVREEQGQAVRRAYADGHPASFGDERVGLPRSDERRVVARADLVDDLPVDLAHLEELRVAEGATEACVVLRHGVGVVANVTGEVEGREGPRADAATPGGEAVAYAGGLEAPCAEKHGGSLTPGVGQARRASRAARPACYRVGVSALPFPSDAWTQAFADAVNASEDYRRYGKPWTFGAVAMVIEKDASLGFDPEPGMILDVHEGVCRGARHVHGLEAVEGTPFVIVAPYAMWKEVIEGERDPIKAMMEGKLKMTTGHLPTMLRFVQSSRALVVSATRVPTEFPH